MPRIWDTTSKFCTPFAIRVAGIRAINTDAKRPRSGCMSRNMYFLISRPMRSQVQNFIAQIGLVRELSGNEKFWGVLQCSGIIFQVLGKPASNALLAFFGQQIIGGQENKSFFLDFEAIGVILDFLSTDASIPSNQCIFNAIYQSPPTFSRALASYMKKTTKKMIF